jgi:hypothetical protein
LGQWAYVSEVFKYALAELHCLEELRAENIGKSLLKLL